MTRAELLELLRWYGYYDEDMRELSEKIQSIVDDMDSSYCLKGTVITGMPGNTSAVSDPTYLAAQKIVDNFLKEIKRIEEKQSELLKKKRLIEELLDVLTREERQVMELRYMRKYKWDAVAVHVHYRRRQCINLRDSALEKMVQLSDKI